MGAMPSRTQSDFYKGLLPIEPSVESPAIFTADLKNDWFENVQPSASEERSRPLVRILIPFCIGVTATLAWQSYSDAARRIIAGWSPQLVWLAPQDPVAQTIPNTIEQIITRIVDRIVTNIAATQEPIARAVDELAAGQEQLAREMIRLQAISQYALHKNAEPLAQPVSAPARNALQRRSQAH
jgi:hypothetical protein